MDIFDMGVALVVVSVIGLILAIGGHIIDPD